LFILFPSFLLLSLFLLQLKNKGLEKKLKEMDEQLEKKDKGVEEKLMKKMEPMKRLRSYGPAR
jgi:hypothetical protein